MVNTSFAGPGAWGVLVSRAFPSLPLPPLLNDRGAGMDFVVAAGRKNLWGESAGGERGKTARVAAVRQLESSSGSHTQKEIEEG